MKKLAENLWIKGYPLTVLGTRHGRNVTVIRLASGDLIIHSMAPFPAPDVDGIRALGRPAWLVEAMLLHDTYAKEGRGIFAGIPFLGPEGFDEVVKFPITPLLPAPPEWAGEIEVLEIKGAPKLKEHVFIHLPSRTLIVADLVFNFPPKESPWNHIFHRYLAGFKRYPSMSRPFRFSVDDKEAFRRSVEELMTKNFDRIIVGHGNVIETDGKHLLRRALEDAGLY
jgi:hypothetical protein